MTGIVPLGSGGIRYLVEGFAVTQRADEAELGRALAGGHIDPPSGPPSAVEHALPLNFDVVAFGGAPG